MSLCPIIGVLTVRMCAGRGWALEAQRAGDLFATITQQHLWGMRPAKTPKPACENLLRLAWGWLTTHEANGNLLMTEEPEAVA